MDSEICIVARVQSKSSSDTSSKRCEFGSGNGTDFGKFGRWRKWRSLDSGFWNLESDLERGCVQIVKFLCDLAHILNRMYLVAMLHYLHFLIQGAVEAFGS